MENYENYYNQQAIHNALFSDEQLSTLSKVDIGDISNGWQIEKRFSNLNTDLQNLKYDSTKWYEGFIQSYRIFQGSNGNSTYYYLNIFCTILLDDEIAKLPLSVPAQITKNSRLTRLLYQLNIAIDRYDYLELDSLIGMPILARIDKKNTTISIIDIKSR